MQDWVDSTVFDSLDEPQKQFEKTVVFQRDPADLLDGCTITEVDIELDTIPAELLDLFEKK